MEEITFMALSDTFTTLGNTIINLVNSRTAHKQNQLVAGDGIQITENSEEKNADICIHPDIEAAFQSVIDEIEAELPPTVLLLESIASGGSIPPEKPFIVSTNLTEIPDYTLNSPSPYYQLLQDNTYVISADLGNLQSIGDYGLSNAFYGCTNLISTGLDNVTSIGKGGLSSAFQKCTSLTSTGLENVTSIGGYDLQNAFSGCTNLTSTGLNNVTSIGTGGLSNAFWGCTSLTSVDFSNLTSIGIIGLQYAFQNCTSLTSLSFPKLNSKSFGSSTNQFDSMLRGVTGCTVHFPSNLESVIGSWSAFSNGFGGTDTVILFDLPSTETSGGGDGGYGDGGYS